MALLLFIGGWGGDNVVHIQLAAFRSGDVDGIWLWRLETTGKYARMCRLPISNPFSWNGIEVVSYLQWCNDGTSRSSPFLAEVVRNTTDPGTVTLTLRYQQGSRPEALYRASAYNSIGESGLSSAIGQL
jgi:hypothetical protein